jgi:hypothetical protein
MQAWFGKHWGAPICDDTPHAVTPTGEPCGHCGEPIEADDAGVIVPTLGEPRRIPFHYECNMRMMVGEPGEQ